MTFDHDREIPFQKILVKNDSETIGIIMRNLETGHYHFYKGDGLKSTLIESRIDTMKAKIESMMQN